MRATAPMMHIAINCPVVIKIISLFFLLTLANFTLADPLAFEISAGRSSGMNNMAYSLGLTGLVKPGLRWRAGFASLGTPSYTNNSAWTTPDDIAEGAGPGPFSLQSPKNDTEIYATIAPEIHRGNWTFSVEGGVGLYRPNSLEDMAPSTVNPDKTSLALTPIAGVSVGYGRTSLVLSMQHMMTRADVDSGPAISNKQVTLSIRHQF